MKKGRKILIFIFVCFVLFSIATAMKHAGAGSVMSIAGIATYILYQAMFSSKKTNDISMQQKEANTSDEITLNKKVRPPKQQNEMD